MIKIFGFFIVIGLALIAQISYENKQQERCEQHMTRDTCYYILR